LTESIRIGDGVELINVTASNQMEVAVTAALPAGTNNIGDVDVLTLPRNTAGNSPGSSTVTTVITLTAPANAVGFILMNLEGSTTNLRYRIGAVATTTSGQQLQPGRDTGYIPCGADISIVAESGTVSYDAQWVLSS
jgi:hypothetical protein